MSDINQSNNAQMDAALAEMAATTSTTDTLTVGPETAVSVAEATPANLPDRQELLTRIPKILSDIDNYLGDFFNSIKEIDRKFGNVADSFYRNASDIMSKEKVTKEEFAEMVTSQVLGMMTSGAGKLWNSLKTAKALANVKQLLANEANDKLESIREIKAMLPDIIDVAGEKYDQIVANDRDNKKLYNAFNEMRLLLYSRELNDFLYETYSAALEGKFQDTVPYPNMYDINNCLLNALISDNEKLSSDEAILKKHRANVKTLFNRMKRTISAGTVPTATETIIAMDKGLMATLIHDLCPAFMSNTDEDGMVVLDEENDLPESAVYYDEIYSLYKVASEKSSNQLSRILLDNKIFCNTVLHYLQFYVEAERCNKRLNILGVNVLLATVLAFLAYLDYGWTWYWALAGAAVIALVFAKLSPFKSSASRSCMKMTYIERTIQTSALNASGYNEPLNLKEIEMSNNNVWIFAILGGLIGLIGGPIGCIAGALLGGFLGSGDNDNGNTDYDYTQIKTGSMVKLYIVTAILSVLLVLTLMNMIGE